MHIEDVYDTDIEDLWAAVTVPARLAGWLGTVEGDLRVGGRFVASFSSAWQGPGRVEVCDAPNRLLVTLEPDTPGRTEVEAILVVEGDRTRLIIEERGLPVEEAPDHGAGWQAHVEDLRAHLAGGVRVPWRDRWHQLIASYRPEQQ